MQIVKDSINFDAQFHWKLKDIPASSPYAEFTSIFSNVKNADRNATSCLGSLCRLYGVANTAVTAPHALIEKYEVYRDQILARYPLLSAIGRYSAEEGAVADYIKMVDVVNTAQIA